MVNRIVLLLLVIAGAVAVAISAGKLLVAPATTSINEQISLIDQSITVLNQEIKQERIHALNAEMEAQALLPVEWNGYTRKIQEVEEHEKVIADHEKRIAELKAKKQILLNQASPPIKILHERGS